MSSRRLDKAAAGRYIWSVAQETPPAFRAGAWLSERVPPRLLYLGFRLLLPLLLRFSADAASVRRAYARVLSRSGRPSGPLAQWRVQCAFRRFYAWSLVALCHNCRPGSPTLRPVKLTALAEIERLRARGKGVILAAPHFGDLISAIFALGHAGVPLSVLMVSGDFWHWAELRSLRFVEFGKGAAECLRALKDNGVVLLYVDTDFFAGNATAEFFGAPIFPPSGSARLAQASGAAILPVAAYWDTAESELVCDEAIVPEDGGGQEALEAALLRALERLIAPRLEQWILLHDPWDLERARAAGREHVDRLVKRSQTP